MRMKRLAENDQAGDKCRPSLKFIHRRGDTQEDGVKRVRREKRKKTY